MAVEVDRVDHPDRSRHPWVRWSGGAATVGAVLWAAMPWVQLATLGTRPYVATGFDVGSLVGWLSMCGGLVGARAAFRDRYGRVGRVGVGLSGAGMVVVSALLCRRVTVFVGAGFRAVPATGEDPAGLVLTWAFLLGFGLVFVGAGLLGLGLWGLGPSFTLAGGVLTAIPLLVVALVTLRFLSVLPTMLGMALVRANVAFVPFAVAWGLLGRLLVVTSRNTE